MPSLEKGDAMSRGFKQHIAKQALIPKIYLKTILDLNFFLGILLAKAQVVDQELHLCKSKDLEDSDVELVLASVSTKGLSWKMLEKVPATKNHVPKHQNQRERLQEQRRPHKSGRCCHYEVAFSNSHPCGDSGGSSIFWLQRSHVLSDWMDEVEEQQDRTMNLIIVNVVT
ncbi:hypothetical protein NC651_019928 [Populus alba x Populus x berolinensis]|nr:hypothetical protein NC651_019928 [Populus alba x Populus x berolinensis]